MFCMQFYLYISGFTKNQNISLCKVITILEGDTIWVILQEIIKKHSVHKNLKIYKVSRILYKCEVPVGLTLLYNLCFITIWNFLLKFLLLIYGVTQLSDLVTDDKAVQLKDHHESSLTVSGSDISFHIATWRLVL